MYFRFLKAGLLYARQQLGNMYRDATNREKMNFTAAGHDFEPTSDIQQGDVDIMCYDGMKGNVKAGMCGRYLISCDY